MKHGMHCYLDRSMPGPTYKGTANVDKVTELADRGYRLGSYFAPAGKWSIMKNGRGYLVTRRTVLALVRRGWIRGNVYWPWFTYKWRPGR